VIVFEICAGEWRQLVRGLWAPIKKTGNESVRDTRIQIDRSKHLDCAQCIPVVGVSVVPFFPFSLNSHLMQARNVRCVVGRSGLKVQASAEMYR